MQIHEVTFKKRAQINEGIGDAFAKAALGYKGAQLDRQTVAMADKAYKAWKTYEAQVLKSNPDARTSGQLEQLLLAFVNKNLLGGMYLPNVINKDKITALVKQIAGAPAQPVTPAAPAAEPISVGGQTLDPKNPAHAKIIAAMQAQGKVEEQTTPSSLGPDQIPGKADLLKGKTPQVNPTTTASTNVAPPPKPEVKQPAPPNEKELFTQLVKQTAIAQTQAAGTGGAQTTPGGQNKGQDSAGNQAGDARGMAQTLSSQLDPGIVKGLPALGKSAESLTGTRMIKSTGNPAADGLLLLMGFQGV